MGPGIHLDSGKGYRWLTKSTVGWVAAEPSNPIDPVHHHTLSYLPKPKEAFSSVGMQDVWCC